MSSAEPDKQRRDPLKTKPLLAVLCLSSLACGQAGRFDSQRWTTATVSGTTGLVKTVPGAVVTVCTYPTATFGACVKAPLCTDATASSCSTSTNPVTADSQGNYAWWILPGKYDYWIRAFGDNVGPYSVVAPDVAKTSFKSLNAVRFADQFPGVDAGAKIQAAINDCPAGGMVYATGFDPGQSASAVITINKSLTLILGTDITVSGSPGIVITASNVTIRGINKDAGHGLIQASAGTNLISASGVSNIRIEGLKFTGVRGASPSSSVDNGVRLSNVTGASVSNSIFTSLRGNGAFATASTDVWVEGNLAFSLNSSGVRFAGVSHGHINRNTVRDVALPLAQFAIAIAVDDSAAFGNSSDLEIVGNIVKTYPNAQGIMAHDGQRLTIQGNIVTDVLAPISVNAFGGSDIINDVAIVGNVCKSTTTPGASDPNPGINVGGTASIAVTNVVINGNTVRDANALLKNDFQGGILLQYASNVSVMGNSIISPYANGITVGASVTNLNVRSNTIKSVQDGVGLTKHGFYVFGTAGTVTGRVEGNVFDDLKVGLRADTPQTGLILGPNHVTNFTSVKILNPTNFTIKTTLDDQVSIGGKVPTFNGINTVSNGTPAEYSQVNLTAQGADIGTSTLYTTPSSGAGWYRISAHIAVTRRATTASTMPKITISWTDQDRSQVQTFDLTSTSGGNALTTFAEGQMMVNAKASTNISYATSGFASFGATTMQYTIRLKLEAP